MYVGVIVCLLEVRMERLTKVGVSVVLFVAMRVDFRKYCDVALSALCPPRRCLPIPGRQLGTRVRAL